MTGVAGADTVGYVAPGDRPAQDWGTVNIVTGKASSSAFSFTGPDKLYDHNLDASAWWYAWFSADGDYTNAWLMW